MTAVLLLTKVRGPSGSSADPKPRRSSPGPEMTAFTVVLLGAVLQQKAFGSACCCLQYIIRMKHAGRCQMKTQCPSALAFVGNGFDCIWIKSSDENGFSFLLLRLELACELFQVDSFPKENYMCFSGKLGTQLTWQ